MKKQILKIGNVLTKSEQKDVFGGFGLGVVICDAVPGSACATDADCCEAGSTCVVESYYLDGHGHYNSWGLGTPQGTRSICT